MKKIFVFLLITAVIAACKKDDTISNAQKYQSCTSAFNRDSFYFGQDRPTYIISNDSQRVIDIYSYGLIDILNNNLDSVSYARLYYRDTCVTVPFSNYLAFTGKWWVASHPITISQLHSLTSGRFGYSDTISHAFVKVYYRNNSGCAVQFNGVDSFASAITTL